MRFSAEKGRVGDEMIEPLLSGLYSLHDGLDGLRLVPEIFVWPQCSLGHVGLCDITFSSLASVASILA